LDLGPEGPGPTTHSGQPAVPRAARSIGHQSDILVGPGRRQPMSDRKLNIGRSFAGVMSSSPTLSASARWFAVQAAGGPRKAAARSLPSARPVAIVSVVTAPVVVAAVAVPASIATSAAVVNGNEDAGRQGQQADEGEGDQTDQTSFVLPHEWSLLGEA
jgi:hypothetical protein